MKKTVFIFVISAFLSLGLSRGESRSGEESGQDPQQHDVSVVLKLVQVYVLDKNGDPVTDLTKEDFEIYDNGRVKPITDFEKHISAPPRPGEERRLMDTEPGQSRELLNRKLFFLFDLTRIGLPGYRRSKEAALHFMQTKVRPWDEIAVLTYTDMSSLKIREYLTRDHERVKAGIESIKEVIGRPSTSGPTLGSAMAEAEAAAAARMSGDRGSAGPSGGAGGGFESGGITIDVSNPQNESAERQNYDYLVIMTEVAKALRYIPGNKNIVMFSHGFPRGLYEGDLIFRSTFEDMAREFSDANSPIHTVNTLGSASRRLSMGARPDSVLARLSEVTGGRYFEDVQYYDEISDGLDKFTGNYYVLGYSIDEKWDGNYNRIEVKVKRPDCRVIAQKGYFNPKSFDKFSKLEKQLHLIDLALNENPQFQAPVRFGMTALSYSQEGPNTVMIASAERSEIEDIILDETELTTMILDDSNNIFASTNGKVDLRTENNLNDRIYFYRVAGLPPGRYRCRLILRNMKTGEAGVGAADISIPDPSEMKDGPSLFPPLLLIPEHAASYIKISHEQEKAGINQTPGIDKIYPYLSNAHSVLTGEWTGEEVEFLAVIRGSGILFDGDLEIRLKQAESEDGEILDYIRLDRTSPAQGKTDVLFLSIEIPELEPGNYTLTFVAAYSENGEEIQTSRQFQVKQIF